MKLVKLISPLVLLLAVAIASVPVANAQHVRYKTKTKMKLESLGFLGGLLDGETVEEISITKKYKRADQKDTSTITDLENRRLVNLNHKKKEYSVITFEEMMEMFEDVADYSQSKVDEAKQDMESNEETAEYDVEFDLRVENTGKTRTIDGHEAKQTVLIIETIFEPKEGSNDSLPSTKLYAINDTWMSDDVPEMEVAEEFNKEMAEAMQQEFSEMNIATVLSSVMESDPRMGSAMEKAQEELMKMEGFPLESIMHIVTVPVGQDIDLELALGEKEEEKSGGGLGGFGGLVKQAMKAQGVDTGEEEDEAEAEPKQATLVSFESRTEDISDKARDMEYYQIPDNYEEVEYERPKIPQAGD